MVTDLKKMVEEWKNTHCSADLPLRELLTAMAKQIDANKKKSGIIEWYLKWRKGI